MLKELISLANSLDERGFKKEADLLDWIIKSADEAGAMIIPPGDDAGAPILPKKPDDVVGPMIMPENLSTEEIIMHMIVDMANEYAKEELNKEEGEAVSLEEAGPFIGELFLEKGKEGDMHIVDKYWALIKELEKKGLKDKTDLEKMKERHKIFAKALEAEEGLGDEEEDLGDGHEGFYPKGLFGPLEMAEASSVINSLIKLSNHLDSLGQYKEADFLDTVIKNAKKKNKPSKKQLEALDKNKNGKIDSEDFELLRKKKTKKKK